MATLSTEVREALKKEHDGDVVVVSRPKFGDFAFKKPNRSIWRSYRHATKDETRVDQRDEMIASCLVFPLKKADEPDTEALDDMLDVYPALVDQVFVSIAKLAGMDDALVGKI